MSEVPAPVVSGRRRRPSRTLIAGALIVALFALVTFRQLRRPQNQADLIEQIKAAGGFVSTEPPPSLQERIDSYRSGSGWQTGYTAVGLYGHDVTGDWLNAHDGLSPLDITDLKLSETSLTGDELARFIREHPLQMLQLREQPLSDAAVDALASRRDLVILELRDCPLTDAQLARLPLEQLQELRVDGTQVTAGGLSVLRRAGRLTVATLDGRQLDEQVAGLLAGLPSLCAIELVGSDVTDAHLQRLGANGALQSIVLTRTAATDDAIKALEAALPECLVTVR